MRKKKSHPVADQFSDDEMALIERYGRALGGSPTAFNEEVERYLRRIEASNRKKKAAIDRGIGPARSRQSNRGET
jgi:hypothetical protein